MSEHFRIAKRGRLPVAQVDIAFARDHRRQGAVPFTGCRLIGGVGVLAFDHVAVARGEVDQRLLDRGLRLKQIADPVPPRGKFDEHAGGLRIIKFKHSHQIAPG